MTYAGIDPGITGALAVIHPGGEIEIIDTPFITDDKTGRKSVDWRNTGNMLLALPADTLITIERQWARPAAKGSAAGQQSQGSIGSFGIGLSFGIWLGALGALDARVQQVTPQAWKKAMVPEMFKDEGKDASRSAADLIWPHARDQWWSRKKDHGRTDALLIAEYGRRLAVMEGRARR